MVLLKNFVNIFYVSELRKKILFTLGVFIIYRFGIHIPAVGIDLNALKAAMSSATGLGGLLGYLDLFSGGSLHLCTIFALGISPYITASIMMQLLGFTVPYLEQLLKEGEYGRKKINQYTRYLAFFISIMQSFSFALILESWHLVLNPGFGFRFTFVLSLTVGSMFVMWLGEQITQYGIGNGSSMIIFAGIVANFPSYFLHTIYAVQEGNMSLVAAILVLAIFIFITACIVFLEKGVRKIPVQYARRIIGNRVYGGQSTFIPFKINPAGVMPVIFAQSVLQIPMFLSSALSKYSAFKWLPDLLSHTSLFHMVLMFLLIVFFSFFYTALQFNPDELADNIKKSGGFLPGIRPGRKTAEFFNYILTRIGFVGALYLGVLAISPDVVKVFLEYPFSFYGTSLLIAVGVGLEAASQIESYLIEHRYEGFLSSGRLKDRSAR
ncbi:MAG: Protein translocase subunit SecY [candidate division TM6 bacterium GW2011_GWF2_30_66]|nr:MAG: Protein translocase subunit SecY [candidate division TM6 bacterium GW2011_GWF2_30_66]